MKNLKKFATQRVVESIQKDVFFKKRCLKEFYFLVDDYGFNEIQSRDSGRGSILTFKKKKNNYPQVIVEYEMGVLPNVEIHLDSETKKIFSENTSLKKYPAHYEIQLVIQKEIYSINNYIRELGTIWENQYEEISIEVETSLKALANQLKIFLQQ